MEEANNWIGLLRLKGWSKKLCKDMRKFNNACGRLAKKWIIAGEFHPLYEIAFIILGSMFIHHFKPSLTEDEQDDAEPERTNQATNARAPSGSRRKPMRGPGDPRPKTENGAANGIDYSFLLRTIMPMMSGMAA